MGEEEGLIDICAVRCCSSVCRSVGRSVGCVGIARHPPAPRAQHQFARCSRPPLSILVRSGLYSIRIRAPSDRSESESEHLQIDRSLALRWNDKDAARSRTLAETHRFFGISQRHLKRNHDGHQRAAKPETESAGRGNERHLLALHGAFSSR